MTTNTARPFRWAIAGTGKIASDFSAQVASISGAELAAVYSRDQANAERFRSAFGMDRATNDFQQLVDDPAIDAIYLAVPAAVHHDFALKALAARKPLLCEKPFAATQSEAAAVLAKAQETQTFCMEAMWLRFSPIIQSAADMVRAGKLGAIRTISIDVGYPTPPARLADADPGRGALLNFAVYGVSLAQMLLGQPEAVSADILRAGSGIDTGCALRLRYANALVNINACIDAELANEAVITGTQGRIRIGAPFFTPGFAEHVWWTPPAADAPAAKARPNPNLPKIDKLPWLGLVQGAFWAARMRRRGKLLLRRPGQSGLKGEAIEVMDCVRAGKTQSERMPHADTLAVAAILDQARASAA
jgi:predicted dehydrogenase